jgi:hypothetical protein
LRRRHLVYTRKRMRTPKITRYLWQWARVQGVLWSVSVKRGFYWLWARPLSKLLPGRSGLETSNTLFSLHIVLPSRNRRAISGPVFTYCIGYFVSVAEKGGTWKRKGLWDVEQFCVGVLTPSIRFVKFTRLTAVMYDPINYKKGQGYENITHQLPLNKHKPPRMVHLYTAIAWCPNTNVNRLRTCLNCGHV